MLRSICLFNDVDSYSLVHLVLFSFGSCDCFLVLKMLQVDEKGKVHEWEEGGASQHLDWIAWVCLIIFTFDGELSQISSTRLRFEHGTFLNQAWKEIDWKENTIMGKQFILFSLTEADFRLYCQINISRVIALISRGLEESRWLYFYMEISFYFRHFKQKFLFFKRVASF